MSLISVYIIHVGIGFWYQFHVMTYMQVFKLHAFLLLFLSAVIAATAVAQIKLQLIAPDMEVLSHVIGC